MQTVIIFDSDKIDFFIVEGRLSHLDGIYVNEDVDDTQLQDELAGIIYGERGAFNHPSVSRDDVRAAICAGAELIVCGCLL